MLAPTVLWYISSLKVSCVLPLGTGKDLYVLNIKTITEYILPYILHVGLKTRRPQGGTGLVQASISTLLPSDSHSFPVSFPSSCSVVFVILVTGYMFVVSHQIRCCVYSPWLYFLVLLEL